MLLAMPAKAATAVLQAVAPTPDESPAPPPVAALCSALQVLQPDPPMASGRRPALSVTVDDHLVRSFVVVAPAGAQSLRELRATAAARFATLYGEPAEAWVLAADWQPAKPFVACAIPRALQQVLEAGQQRWRVDSLCPALVRVWNRVRAAVPADGWLLVGFGQTLTLLHTQHGEVAGLRTLRLSSAPGLGELATLIEQERLRSAADAASRARQTLLWAGAASWLPAATMVAGVASRALPLPATLPAQLPDAWRLALAGAGE